MLAAAAAAAAGGEVGRDVQLSCGEHCDYGLLTLVNQDPGVTALQVGSRC
jgi:isopenicillin N synthase-like dioxygenase